MPILLLSQFKRLVDGTIALDASTLRRENSKDGHTSVSSRMTNSTDKALEPSPMGANTLVNTRTANPTDKARRNS